MDPTLFLDVKPAPVLLLERAQTRRQLPRYMVPTADGDWRPLTWGEHATAMRNAGSGLLDLGLHHGDRVAIFAGNRPEWIEAALGAQAAGLVVVPIYQASTAEQAAYVIQHSDARVLFVADAQLLRRCLTQWQALAGVTRIVIVDDCEPLAIRDQMADEGEVVPSTAWLEQHCMHFNTLCTDGARVDAAEPHRLDERLAALDLSDNAMMLYTSGTTGSPKGVPLTHGNLAINGRDWVECNAPALPDDGIDVLWLPMSHIFGFGEACLGNNLGFTTYLAAPADVLEVVPQVRPNVFMSVPAYWDKLAATSIGHHDAETARAALDEATGGRLRFCLSGGAGLSGAIKAHYERCGIVILEGYGLTECSPTLTLNRPSDYRFDSVGKPLPSVQLRLADDGEILARGPTVFAGYHKDPAATRAAFDDEGWFKTGDIGVWTDDGFLRIVDRKKEILVTAGGKNVPPANIERLFAADPLFSHVVVYGDGRKYLVAGVWLDTNVVQERVAAAGGDADDPQVVEGWVAAAVAAANAKLARFEQIKRFRVMDSPLSVANGLLTSTLKVRRKRVYAQFEAAFAGLYA